MSGRQKVQFLPSLCVVEIELHLTADYRLTLEATAKLHLIKRQVFFWTPESAEGKTPFVMVLGLGKLYLGTILAG